MSDVLALFDLDGTLITMWELHDNAYESVIHEIYGIPNVKFRESDYRPGGTSEETVRAALKHVGCLDAEIDPKIDKVVPELEEYYKTHVKKDDITILPGAKELLQKLNDNGTIACLVTGNPVEFAESVLRYSGLMRYIPIVVGADTSATREGRITSVIAMATRRTGKNYAKDNIYFFDDSKFSIPVSKSLGIRSIAVATGAVPYDELEKAGPYKLLRDLNDTKEILHILSPARKQ